MKVAILGFGVVGSGTAEVLISNSESIAKKAGEDILLKYILDIRDFSDNPLGKLVTNDFEKIIDDGEIKVIAEVMGGVSPAYEYTKRALEKGISVVTSNKELVATHGTELLKIARENNANYLFEASVGGGIPVIRPLCQCLSANKVKSIVGILNGTTNYILTKMIKENVSFESALKEAQDKGYAEKNPAADIEGIDSCRKIAILSSLVFGKNVDPNKVYTEGITKITLEDVELAGKDNKVIKLLGRTYIDENEKVSALVSPCLVSKDNPISGVDDVFNAITVEGDAVGEVMFYGRGAGKLPTASAVVADIIDAAKHTGKNKGICWEKVGEDFVKSHEELETSFFIRVLTEDKNVLEKYVDIVKYIPNIKKTGEICAITKTKKEREILSALKKLENDGIKIISKIRVLD